MRLIAVREGADKLVRTGQLTGATAFLRRRIFVAPAQIFKNGPGEQHVFLQHNGHLIAQRFQIVFAHVVAADENRSLRRVVEAGNQAGQRGFSAARTAQDSDCLPWLNAQADVLQDGLPAAAPAVGEGDVPKFDAAVRHFRSGIRRAGQIGLLLDDLADPLRAGNAHAHHDKNHGDHHQTHQNAGNIAEQAHEVALGEALRHAGLRAQPRQGEHAAENRRHHNGVVQRHIGFRLDKHPIDRFRRFGKLGALIVLAHEGLDHADGADVLLHAGVQVVIFAEHAVENLRRLGNHKGERKDQNRHGNDEHHAQLRVNGKRKNQRGNQHGWRAHADAQQHLVGHLQIRDIRRQPGHKTGRGKTIDVGKGKRLDICEHRVAQVCGKAGGSHRSKSAGQNSTDQRSQSHKKHPAAVFDNRSHSSAAVNAIVDNFCHQERQDHIRNRLQRRENRRDERHCLVLLHLCAQGF